MSEPAHSDDLQPPPLEVGSDHDWLHRLLSPKVVFTAIAVLGLLAIWGVTLDLAARERAAAHRATALLASDLALTYEAQVVRALREIDHTLKLVRHQLADQPARQVLEQLRANELLPPELLFTVSIIDARDRIVASTHPEASANVPTRDQFQAAGGEDELMVSTPLPDAKADGWRLDFSRRLEPVGESFAGLVMVSVHAGYFVSGYEPRVMGEQGTLGLLGTDGVFRIRRTGDEISAGTATDYNAVVRDVATRNEAATVQENGWDGVRRYTIATELFEFPLAIVVGLSAAEQLASADRLARSYLQRAALASVLLVGLLALLGRLSWQLHAARAHGLEERVANARRIEYLAYYDQLTDLPNRALFSRLLSQSMQQARRYERCLALLFLDLDQFKAINDSLGHEAGDELLQETANRLRASVRDSDVVARLGGDEFVVLLPELATATQVAPVAEKILAAVGRPFMLVGQEFRVTVSVGASIFPLDGVDEQTLMKNADTAMYHAKSEGKNNFQLYSEKLNSDSQKRLALESSMRQALERQEFLLYYQAKHDMQSGRLTGMEALLRWQHPDLGLLAPMQFIPLAEENGLIVPIGRWVLETACRQNVAWQKEGLPVVSMAVNISARQFHHENLLADIESILRTSGMAPELLEVEITESMIMRDMERTIQIIEGVKQMGVRIAIDDFGTGYSSLSKLKAFQLDTIKIDGAFIKDLIGCTEDRGLTEAIIAMGKSLSLTVVAEGVESAEQAEFLRAHGCDQFQGFYMDEPAPAEAFAQHLRSFGNTIQNC